MADCRSIEWREGDRLLRFRAERSDRAVELCGPLPQGLDEIAAEARGRLPDRGRREALLAALRPTGVALRGVGHDTMLMSYCSEPGLRSHALADLALKHFAFKKTSAKDVVGTGKKQRTFAEVDPALVGNYVSEEADLVLRLIEPLEQQLERAGTTQLYRDLELPLVPVLLDMEWEGIAVDTQHLMKLSHSMSSSTGTRGSSRSR